MHSTSTSRVLSYVYANGQKYRRGHTLPPSFPEGKSYRGIELNAGVPAILVVCVTAFVEERPVECPCMLVYLRLHGATASSSRNRKTKTVRSSAILQVVHTLPRRHGPTQHNRIVSTIHIAARLPKFHL